MLHATHNIERCDLQCGMLISDIISTDEDPGLRIESFAVIKNTWCIYKL